MGLERRTGRQPVCARHRLERGVCSFPSRVEALRPRLRLRGAEREWGELGGVRLARVLQGPASPAEALAAPSRPPPPPGLETLPPCSEHLGFRPDLEPSASTKPFPTLTPTCLPAKLMGRAGGDRERVGGLWWGPWAGVVQGACGDPAAMSRKRPAVP